MFLSISLENSALSPLSYCASLYCYLSCMCVGVRSAVVDISGSPIHDAVLRFDGEFDDFPTFSDGYQYRILPDGDHTIKVAAHGRNHKFMLIF